MQGILIRWKNKNSDQTAQAYLSLRWVYMSVGTFSHVEAQFFFLYNIFVKLLLIIVDNMAYYFKRPYMYMFYVIVFPSVRLAEKWEDVFACVCCAFVCVV